MSTFFTIISGAIPSTLGKVVAFHFDLPGSFPDHLPSEEGILYYMIDTRHGERTYEIALNGTFQDKIVLPTGNYLATLNIEVKNLQNGTNLLTFESSAGVQPLNILNVMLIYELSDFG
jgi:hypothetical protein